MRITGTVTTSIAALKAYAGSLDATNQKVYFRWAVRYRSFVQRRFNTFSRGGGDWPPLAASTIKKRKPAAKRKGTQSTPKVRVASILRDTNTLYTALTPAIAAPAGSINQLLSDGSGIEVGFAGEGTHPGGATIAQIALWHQTGAGNLPVREIIVLPDQKTIDGMSADLERAHKEAIRNAQNAV